MGFSDGVKALSEPVTKLIEAVSNAIGKAYEPRHRRKMADAKAYEINKIAEALRNNCDLPIQYNGEAIINIVDYDDLRKRAGLRLAYQEIQKQENIETVVDKACIELDGKQLESEESISPEWMNRFINLTGEISTEEMQNIWAKVLAGEIVRPSSYSMKTIECLRNLSVRDAELFSKVANYVISDKLIYGDNSLNQKHNISYGEILMLDDCGLINSSGTIVSKQTINKPVELIIDFGEYVLIAVSSEGQTVTFPQFPLTRAGKELLQIARNRGISDQYVSDIVEAVKKKNREVKLQLHKVNGRNEERIDFETEETLLIKEKSYTTR